MLCFSILFSGHGKGLFIVPAVTNVLPLCPLTAFVWSGRTCRPTSRVTFTLARQRQVCFVPQSIVALLSCHGINAFSLFPSRHAPNNSPLKLASFGWSVILAERTSQKGLGRNRKIDFFLSPHHQIIPPLLLIFGPWPHHVLYWLGTGCGA